MEPTEKPKKAKEPKKKINVYNRKASFEFELLDEFDAGIVLLGSEIKSMRDGRVSIAEAYCYLHDGKVIVKNMHIAQLKNAAVQHDPLRERCLLLKKKEVRKLQNEVKDSGITIVIEHLYEKKGLAKVKIRLARGKKLFDKRESIKKKDMERDLKREGL